MNQDPADGEFSNVTDKLKAALGDAELEHERLLDARELLRELGMCIDEDPRPDLKMLCSTMQGMLSDLLTRRSFSHADALRVLRNLVDCIGSGVGEHPRHLGRVGDPFLFPGTPALSYRRVSESMLGEILIRRGSITREQLDEALGRQRVDRKRLGEVLVAMEAIDVATLEDAFHEQREETLRMAAEPPERRKSCLRLVEDPPPPSAG